MISDSNTMTADAPAAGTTVVQFAGITKTYFKPDGSVLVEALKDVDLEICQGEYVAIMGASGSGKSTLMNIIGCLDRPTSGQYMLDGTDVAQMDDLQLSGVRGRKIGFVFQAFNLISALSILENVEVPLFYQHVSRHDRLERAKSKLELVGLGNRMSHRPAELSGGQQQRAAIARSLVMNPALVLADEPTGNLDSQTGRSILDLFDELHRGGLTLVMVTHDDEVARRCERIIRLKDGEVDSDEVLRRTGVLCG